METRELLEEIYPRLDRAQAVGSLNPRDKGNYYLLTCPKCKKRGAYLYKTGVVIKCNRLNECKYSISLWDYIQETKDLSNQETPRELVRLTHSIMPSFGRRGLRGDWSEPL